MKKYISYAFVLMALVACEKEATEQSATNSTAAVAVLHAAPGAPTVDLVVDGLVPKYSRRLTYGITALSGGAGNGQIYVPLLAGTRNIKVSADSGRTNVFNADLPFEVNKSYTAIVYDTLSAARNSLLVARLEDNLSVPATGQVHARFIHASPRGGAWDVTFLRTSATPNDSVTLTNRYYLGATPNVTTLSAFTPLPAGTYTLKIKAAGTQNVVFSSSLGTNFATSGRIFTIVSIGTAQSQALATVNLRHY
ncbi:MAG: DUF4397 domain-containing protein [Chitinophagaceae bacterium]